MTEQLVIAKFGISFPKINHLYIVNSKITTFSNRIYAFTVLIIKTFITRKFAEAANARSVDCTEEKRLQSLFEDVQRDVR